MKDQEHEERREWLLSGWVLPLGIALLVGLLTLLLELG